VDFTPPRSCRYSKGSPPKRRGGIKKPERSGVWVAHCSFTSGRPNETACGLHTALFASGGPNETAGCTPPRLHLEGQTRRRVGCTPPRLRLEGQTRRCVGCTPPRCCLEGSTSRCVGYTPPCWLLLSPLALPVPSSLPPHSHLSSMTPRSW